MASPFKVRSNHSCYILKKLQVMVRERELESLVLFYLCNLDIKRLVQ